MLIGKFSLIFTINYLFLITRIFTKPCPSVVAEGISLNLYFHCHLPSSTEALFLSYPSTYYVMFLMHTQWYVAPKTASNNPFFLVRRPLCYLCLEWGLDQVTCFQGLEHGKSNDSGLQKDYGFHLGCSFLLSRLLWKMPAASINCPMQGHRALNCGRSPNNRQWETEALIPVIKFCQQPREWACKWIHLSQLGLQMSIQPQPALWL